MEGDIVMSLALILISATALTVAAGYVMWWMKSESEQVTGFGINPMTWLIIAVILVFIAIIYFKSKKG